MPGVLKNAIDHASRPCGQSAWTGKPAGEITPKEAAFFSSILPNPKERYKQYCKGELRRQTEDKIGRILAKIEDQNATHEAQRYAVKPDRLRGILI